MPSSPTAAPPDRSLTAGSPPRRVGRTALGALTALLLLIGILGPSGPHPNASADDADTDFDTWTQVAQNIGTELNEAVTTYTGGNTTGAASAFQRAYNSGYVASKMPLVTIDRLGQNVATTEQQAFEALRKASYTAGNDETITADVASLSSALLADAGRLDALSDLPGPRDYAAQRSSTIATERASLQASRTQVNEGRGERTWTEVAAEMTALINSGVDKAANGDGDGGADDVNKAYYGYYEKLGFEKTVMSAISGDRVSVVENQFKVVRKAMVSGASASEVRSAADTLISYIQEDAATLDGGAAQSISPIKAFFTGSFGQALILLREGLEAILVVAAIIAYLIKAGMKDRVKHIYAGIVLGLVGSGIVAVLFAFLYNSASAHQEILEGVVALVAMGMLLFTSNWMLSKSSVESWNRYIKDRTEASISDGGFWALASLSFLAVFREGAETVLFYEALFTMDPGGKASIWQGFAVGVVLLVAIFLLIRFTSVKIPLRPFFAVTSFLMAVLVVIFAGGGAHALYEGDLIPGTYVPGWPTYDYLGIYPYKQTLGFQAFMLLVVIVLSVASVLHRRRRAAVAAAADAGSDDVKSSDDSSAIESDASDDAAATESADAVAGSDAESADDAESAPKSTTE